MCTPEDTGEEPEPSAEQAPSAEKDPRISTVQNWYKAKDEADHYNRNLMQYGGGVAAVLTLLAGSGGIFAVATAVKVEDNPYFDRAAAILGGVSVVGTIALVILTVMLVHSFVRRRKAEKAVDKNRRSLINEEIAPFLPTTQPMPPDQRP